MKITEISIARPVFASMMMVIIVVFGTVLYMRLPVDLFPDVNFPVVTATVVYPGADTETMERRVAEPIEEAVSGLAGIRMLRSTSLEGVTQVALQFELSVDLDTATQDVRDRIASIQDELPDAAETPLVEKLDLGAAPIMQLSVSGDVDEGELSRFAEDVLKPGIERISGVGQLELVGTREREVHVYVDNDRLRAYRLTVEDVIQALRAQNLEVPGGRLDDGAQELSVRTTAEAETISALSRTTMRAEGGAVVRLSDVATVVDGLEERRSSAWVNGQPAIALIVRKQSGANTVAVAREVREALPELRRQAPAGTRIDVLFDNAIQIQGSIDTVLLDLVLGALLCVGIIFLFLRDLRATFIAALTLPTTVIGTLGVCQVLGFSLNLMTTLALSLSIGILIDDAIVVIENIVRHKTKLGEKTREAAYNGTAELGLAVLATSAAIVAVFVPVAFMDGIVGQFFYEFGIAVTVAIIISTFIALTMTPMLASLLLSDNENPQLVPTALRQMSDAIERFLNTLDEYYRAVIRFALGNRLVTVLLAAGALFGSCFLMPAIGFEFIPPEDRNQFLVVFELPVGTSLEQSEEMLRGASAQIEEIPGVDTAFLTVGGGARAQVNEARMIVNLDHRETRAYHQSELMSYIRRIFVNRDDILAEVQELDAVDAGGENAPVQWNLRGDDLEELATVARSLADELRATEGFVDVDITYRDGRPEVEVRVDQHRADDVGVVGASVATSVRYLVEGEVATEIDLDGDRHDVRVQLPPAQRRGADSIRRAQVRSNGGALVDIGTVAEVAEQTGPAQIDRQARQRQITVTAQLEGLPLGNASAVVREKAGALASDTITQDEGGMGEMLAETVDSMLLALFLAIVCIYVILASQFESLIHPLTIMISLPLSVSGALGLLLVTGESMSIFAMIGFIMLMGLATKNAILLVDFANQLRAEGKAREDALVEAGATRLRPILMTTLAMIFGMLPVAIGHGDGGEVRRAMGVAVIGGLLTSTVLTLVVVPTVYTLLDGLSLWVLRLVTGRSRDSLLPPADRSTAGVEGVAASAEE